MIVSNTHNFVYISITKTGTRSMYVILKSKFNGKMIGDHLRVIPVHLTKHFTFATVKNPYDRCCSAYWSTCYTKNDQYKFIHRMKKFNIENNLHGYLKLLQNGHHKHITTHPQAYWLNANRVDYLIHAENMVEEFNKLPFVKKECKLPHINSSRLHKGRPPTKELLTKESIKLINELYKKDFGILNYTIIRSLSGYLKHYDDEIKE